MMKKTALSLAAIAIVSSAPLQAAPKKPDAGNKASEASKHDQGDSNRQTGRSQGNFHANWHAIANVCGKDNPAATHSALCVRKPVSPS